MLFWEILKGNSIRFTWQIKKNPKPSIKLCSTWTTSPCTHHLQEVHKFHLDFYLPSLSTNTSQVIYQIKESTKYMEFDASSIIHSLHVVNH